MIATSLYRGVFRTYVNIHAIFRPGVHFFLTFHHFKLEAHVINRNCVFPCKILARPYQQTNLSVKSGVHGKIDHLHSCDQVPLCKFLGRKERFYRKKEFNPHRIFFDTAPKWPPLHCFVHQYGRRDVTFKAGLIKITNLLRKTE